jgi:hypothetical protein
LRRFHQVDGDELLVMKEEDLSPWSKNTTPLFNS